MIDKTSPVPLCHQLAETLREKTRSGEWLPSDQIPTEDELCQRYGVSRTTVRQAVSILVNEGLLIRVRPKGTFVAGPVAQTVFFSMPEGLLVESTRKSLYVRTEVLCAEKARPMPSDLASSLGVPQNTRFHYLERVRYGRERPVLFTRNWVVAERCPDLLEVDFTRYPLFETLKNRFGFTIETSRRSLKPVQAKGRLCRLLEIPPQTALFLVTSQDYTGDNRFLSYFECTLRPEYCMFSFRIGRRAGGNGAEGNVVELRLRRRKGD